MKPQRSGLTLRYAYLSDACELASIKTLAAKRAYANIFTPTELESWIQNRGSEQFVREKIGSADLYAVATVDGSIVGGGRISQDSDGRCGYLADLYVSESGNGVGSALVRTLLSYAEARDWDYVRTFTMEGNGSALRFLLNSGFILRGQQKDDKSDVNLLELVRGV